MLIWYGAGAVAAIVLAWLVALVHASGHAPVGLVSLVVGLALGAILAKIAANQQIVCRTRLIIGTILLAIVAVLSEHTWLYLDFRRQWQESRATSAQVAMFRPEQPWSPSEYFAHELTPQSAALWCVDAVLIVTSATGVAFASTRRKQ
jgi:hypothetical protein